jgi:hypothetical protein
MSKLSIFFIVLFCSLFSSITGGFAGYYAALAIPTVSSVAVLDIEEIASRVEPNSPDSKKAIALLTAKARDVTEKLTAAGMVVLDRSAVVSAPADSIVKIDLSPAAEFTSKAPAK